MGVPAETRPIARPARTGQRSPLWAVIASLLVFVAALMLATSRGGTVIVGAILALIAAAVITRRPAIGILIYLTTFLFTYPAFLRGSGNFTVNNIMGLILLPLMLYGMLREGNLWMVRFRPIVLLGVIVVVMMGSAMYYVPSTQYVDVQDRISLQTSRRAQGPALIMTRNPGTKFLTRFVFLTFFVFFIRSPRDIKWVVGMIVACLLLTYLNVSTEAGPFGWGAGRLRVLGERGAAVYAGRNPNKLAYFALFALTLLWYGRRVLKSPIAYPFWLTGAAIAFIMIPLTGSRSGLLNLLVFIGIVLMEGRFNYRKVVGMAFITLFIAIQFGYNMSVVDLLFPSDVASRLTRFDVRREVLTEGVEAQGSAEGRVQTAQAALRIWRLHPIFGVGIGNFETERAATDPTGTVGPPHNSYLWALSEGGLVVFTLYLATFIWTFRKIREIEWEYEARYGPVGLGWLVSGMRTVLIGFLFFSFFADMWHHILFYIIMGMCLALIRMHHVYAETGSVPDAFRFGTPVAVTAP